MINLIKKQAVSFGYALNGIICALRTQRHMRFHVIATVFVLCLGGYFQIDKIEWSLIILSIATVWIAEMINTAIEVTVDMITIEQNEKAKIAKDVAAGAVLSASIFASIVGMIIFYNPLIQIYKGVCCYWK